MPKTAHSPYRDSNAKHLEIAERGLSAWQRLCPNDSWRDPVLLAIERYLDEPETREAMWQLEGDEVYPRPVLDGMRERGLMTIFAPAKDPAVGDSRVTAFHQCAINASDARRNTSVAVTISVNSLALISAYVSATPEQFAAINARVQEGAFSSLLLSELSHGSNLLANQCRAERGTLDEDGGWVAVGDDEPCTHYKLSGEKDLINGANEHELLFPFLRTRNFDVTDPKAIKPLQARADFSMFWLERQPTIQPLPRWKTLPAQGADISGLDFNGTVVTADHVLGREHGGMTVAQKTLILSRGGVASLAAGCLSGARDLAVHYAQRRAIYGEPIHTLGAIADHLLKLEALDRVVSAISLRTTALINAYGVGVSHYTGVAKVIASSLGEEGVTEGKRVLGARALLRDFPYARCMQDAVLYAVFDGTTHLMFQELSHGLAKESRRAAKGPSEQDTLAVMREVYAKPAVPVYQSLSEKRPRLVLPLERHLQLLGELPGAAPVGALSGVCQQLFAAVRGCEANGVWKAEQHLKLRAAELFATLEGLAAFVELADVERRAALGVPPVAEARALDGPLASYTVSWLGRRVLAGVRELALDAGLSEWEAASAPGLAELEAELAAGQVAVRQACREALVG